MRWSNSRTGGRCSRGDSTRERGGKLSDFQSTGVYEFETAEIKGSIRAGNALPHHGVTRLRHRASGVEFAHPDWSMLNIFRIMGVDPASAEGVGADLGSPRAEDHEAEVSDRALTLHWPPIPDRQVDVKLTYEIAERHIDLTATIRAEAAYGRFEILLSSYNMPGVYPHVFLARDKFELADVPGKFKDDPDLVRVTVSDVVRGGVIVFPRDPGGARVFADGRWDTVARFSPARRYKLPLMFHKPADSSVAAVWMTSPDTCFAVGTGYYSDDPEDRFAFNNPSYLSLFGDDIEAGQELRARARLAVVELEDEYADAIDLYDQFRR